MMFKYLFLFFVSFFSFGQLTETDTLNYNSLQNKISNHLISPHVVDSLKIDSLSNRNLFKINVLASYYAKKFNGRRTASGETFSNHKFTAAHKTLPFGTKLLVTNEKNGQSVIVTVNDRGPFGKSKEIDLSHKAFLAICNHKNEGLLRVNIEVLE
jgi:rare lipoprotein A